MILALSLSLALPTQLALPAYQLATGDSWTGQVTQRYLNEREELDLQFRDGLTVRVGKSESGTVRLEHDWDIRALFIDGEQIEVKPQRMTLAETRTLSGVWLAMSPPDVEPIRRRRLSLLLLPPHPPELRLGHEWKQVHELSDKSPYPKTELSLKVVRLDQQKNSTIATIAGTYSEGAAAGEGRWEVEYPRGIPISAAFTIKNLPVPGGEGLTADYTITWRLTAFKAASGTK